MSALLVYLTYDISITELYSNPVNIHEQRNESMVKNYELKKALLFVFEIILIVSFRVYLKKKKN